MLFIFNLGYKELFEDYYIFFQMEIYTFYFLFLFFVNK